MLKDQVGPVWDISVCPTRVSKHREAEKPFLTMKGKLGRKLALGYPLSCVGKKVLHWETLQDHTEP